MKALVAVLTIALAGAGLSGAVLTGTLPLLKTNAAEPEPAQGWEVLETFTGAADAATGTLDLRTFWGNVQVNGWSEPAYEITVYQRAPKQTGQSLSDAKIVATFAEKAEDGLGLSLLVERTGSYDINVGQDGWTDIAIVANVPGSIDWSTAFVCSGEDGSGMFREALMPVLGVLMDHGADEARTCVPSSPMADMSIGSIQMNDDSTEEEVAAFPFALAGLHGGELMVMAQYADLGLDGLSFAKAAIMTQYGNVLGTIDAPELAVMSQYGRIGLTSVADTADIFSQYGDLYLQLSPGASGAFNVNTQYGEVVLGLPGTPDQGYDVEGQTQYGEVLIILDGIETSSGEDEGAFAPAALLKAGLPGLGKAEPPKRPSGMDNGNAVASAKSERFDLAAVQTVVKAMTQYGDVLVTDGAMPEYAEDDDTA